MSLPSRAPFVFVTGNPNKLAEARRLAGLDFEAIALDLPEIQSLSFEEIAREKAEEAWRRVGEPLGREGETLGRESESLVKTGPRALVVEEAGLSLAALNGFPGPLVKWMLEAAGAAGLARTALSLGDARAWATAVLVYRDRERTLLATGRVDGTLTLPPRGDHGFGFDPVFVPQGETRTFGELRGEAKDAQSHRGRAWRALLAQLAD